MNHLDLSLLSPAEREELQDLHHQAEQLRIKEERLLRRMARGNSLEQVAKNLGISKSYTSLIERTALRKLRKRIDPSLNPNNPTS